MIKDNNPKTPKDEIEEYISKEKVEKIEIIPEKEEVIIEDLDNIEDESDKNKDKDNEIVDLDNMDDDAVYFKFNTTSHKMEGKHRLKRDTIFYGKLNEEVEEDYLHSSNSEYYNKDFPIEKGTIFEMESRNHEEMQTQRQLKGDIYNILEENTDLDFTSNRRKPNKQAFNTYYEILLRELKNKYTKSEIFVELSYYFTDHIFNMYKLLYPQHATNIIMELRDKGYLNELDNMTFV